MTPQTEVGVAGDEHPLVHRTVRAVAGNAAFAHGAVFINKRALLLRVATGAGLVLGLKIGAGPLDRIAAVRVVAVAAAHLAGENRVSMRQVEFAAFVEVTGEAGFGRLLRIDDGTAPAAGLHVLAARTMAGFAADVQPLGRLDGEACVRGVLEAVDNLAVAGGALVGAHVFGSRNLEWCDDRPISGGAGQEEQRPGAEGSEEPHVADFEARNQFHKNVPELGAKRVATLHP